MNIRIKPRVNPLSGNTPIIVDYTGQSGQVVSIEEVHKGIDSNAKGIAWAGSVDDQLYMQL